MLACLLLLSATTLGLAVATTLGAPLRASWRLGVGLAVGQALLLWVPFLLALVLRLDARAAGLTASAVCVLGSVGAWLALARRADGAAVAWIGQLARRLREPSARVGIAVLGAFVGLFAWLLHTHFLLPRADGVYSASVTWGDLPMHLALASRFLYAEGPPPLEHPLFLHGPLMYPFLPDHDVAVLAALGMSLRAAFIVSGALSFFSLGVLVHALARFWLDAQEHEATPSLAVVAFFLAGGLGFVWFLGSVLQGQAPLALLAETNFTYLADDSILKAGHLGNLFVAARTATPGMAIGIAVLLLLGHVRESLAVDRKTLLVAGLLAGSLPLVHGHSFLVVCGVLGCYALTALPARVRLARWAWACIPLVLVAAPQLAYLQSASTRSFVRLAPGFLRQAHDLAQGASDVLVGVGAPLLLLPFAFRASAPRARRLAWPLLCLLPLVCFVTFTPTYYDNVKLVAWFDLAAAILTAGLLARFLVASRVLAIATLVACTFTGALAVAHELLASAPVVTHEEIAFAELVRQRTPPSAVIATAASGHDPVAMFSGRRVLAAAPYMLSTHGIDVRERARDIVLSYAAAPSAPSILQRLEVTAIVVGPHERAELPALNEAWIAAQAVERHELAGHTLYVLRR